MTLAEDLVTAAAEKISNHVRPKVWADEVARLAVVATLDKLAADGLVMFRHGGFGDRVEIGELATEVESGVPQAEKPQP